MDLSDYREKIDSVDKQIVKLFSERMDIARQCAIMITLCFVIGILALPMVER